ncbi:hypothetical protein JCM14469_22460 [Desulfatiferula olefinivorans]
MGAETADPELASKTGVGFPLALHDQVGARRRTQEGADHRHRSRLIGAGDFGDGKPGVRVFKADLFDLSVELRHDPFLIEKK